MKKKIFEKIIYAIFVIIFIYAVCNTYKSFTNGNQTVRISTESTAYTNSDLYVSVMALDSTNSEIESTMKIKLLDSNEKKVKNAEITYDDSTAIISIPEVETGKYYIQATVKSEKGKDTVTKEVYITQGNMENVTISMDKGIYKPGDTINFRALLTETENDEPVSEDINISIYDGNSNKVYTEDVTTSNYGIASGSFDLADELNSGTYELVVTTNTNETTKQFIVNPYVTPKYELTINNDKETYLVEETATITLNAEYFFGEAVANAEFTVYINDEEYGKYVADESGNSSFTYTFDEAKTYEITVEAVDSSNYYVEETEEITVGTDIFEIELLPEYGSIISGMSNNIYVFTKSADGTPVKTYVTVKSGSFSKQIITDENGIGTFKLDSSSITTLNKGTTTYKKSSSSVQNFDVTAQNMQEEEVTKNISLNVTSSSLVMTTDKVKYEQSDDITLNIISEESTTRNIYFLKNSQIIKMISTDSTDVTTNLEDTYGLIDIYIVEGAKNEAQTYKRTVFINPSKELNISISTDKEEYEPGDNINISFTTKDEEDENTDAALLVSMIDNQVLSLASNDLSIDNIKLALSGINFTEDIDAATLYACIVNNESEQTIMGLLLKQSSSSLNVSESYIKNSDEAETATIKAIFAWIIALSMFLIILTVKIPFVKVIIKHILNLAILELLIVGITYFIIEELFYRTFDFTIIKLGIELVLGLALYIAVISRINEKITRTSISILILGIICYIILFIIEEIGGEISVILMAIIAFVLLATAIMSRTPKFEDSKIKKYIIKELIYILKFLAAGMLSIIIGNILGEIIPIDSIGLPLGIIALYILNYLFNIKERTEKERRKASYERQDEVYNIKVTSKIIDVVAVTIVGLALIGILSLGVLVYNNAKQTVDGSALSSESSSSSSHSSSVGDISLEVEESASSSSSSSWVDSASSAALSFLDDASDLFSSAKSSSSSDTNDTEEELESEIEVATVNVEEEAENSETTSNIRSVFLESMCFIPELIAENGETNLNLTLSDNITTWTIQTIGNTQDGKVGYGIIDNVKVSKEFFIDFDIPNNLVEGDTVSIPVTIYNYTENSISTTLNIQNEEWFNLNSDSQISVEVAANSTQMQYVSITINNSGSNKFRVEASNGTVSDIVEKTATVNPNGYKVEKVVSTGALDGSISEDILILDDIIKNTATATVKIYSTAKAQVIEGMENIFKMPTGCFEQVSSSLYPNILALKYLEDTNTADTAIREKALGYISAGYQKILAYEVKGETGGYAYYGKSPAETVITAYGLMELTDLSEVYSVDENVLTNMTEFLYGKQKTIGSFTITGTHTGGANTRNELALNSYITWALSESDPDDSRLAKSVSYLKGKLDDVEDNYTLALIANVLANVGDNTAKDVLDKLVANTVSDEKGTYLTSSITDYYGTKSKYQTIQTVALTSIALSKTGYNSKTNELLIDYLISQKDSNGTWNSTQATILALKAINELNVSEKLKDQTIKVSVNSETQEIEIGEDSLSYYTATFDNLSKENKLNIEAEKSNAYYEVIEEYYIPWDNVETEGNELDVNVSANTELSVNDILTANIKVTNNSSDDIINGMVVISVPQGFTVDEDSLLLLENNGVIQKYETSYTEINLYLQNFEASEIINLAVDFRASYPVSITGLSVKAYDYYNPDIEGISKPIEIKVN